LSNESRERDSDAFEIAAGVILELGGADIGGIGEGYVSIYYADPKSGRDAAADAGGTGYKVGRDDGG